MLIKMRAEENTHVSTVMRAEKVHTQMPVIWGAEIILTLACQL
jgi:hypothetical protein